MNYTYSKWQAETRINAVTFVPYSLIKNKSGKDLRKTETPSTNKWNIGLQLYQFKGTANMSFTEMSTSFYTGTKSS